MRLFDIAVPIVASDVLPNLALDDVREAVDGIRPGLASAERPEVASRIVRRRQRFGVRVREEEAPSYWPAPNARPEVALPDERAP